MSTPPSPASLKLNRERRRLKATILIIVLTIIMLLGSAALYSIPFLAIAAMAVSSALLPLSWKYLLGRASN